MITPLRCPAGTYNSESTTAAYCTVCDAGYYCPQSDASPLVYKLPCEKGFYSAEGATECTLCPVGTYCPNEATSETQKNNQLCPKGTFCKRSVTYFKNSISTTEDGGIDVWPNKKDGTGGYACPLYKYCPKGTINPLDIPRGTMQELWARGSLEDAIQMPPGNYSAATGTPSLPFRTTECAAGYYCPKGSFAMIACPTGFFRANKLGMDADSCGLCPAGTYCPTEGTSVPKACPIGHFCPEGAAEA